MILAIKKTQKSCHCEEGEARRLPAGRQEAIPLLQVKTPHVIARREVPVSLRGAAGDEAI
jgi:hypothetical protein